MSKHIIYGLADPRTSLIHYIGKSSSGLKRPNGHMAKTRLARDSTIKGDWLRELVSLGLRCEVKVLQIVERFQLDEAECYWIAYGHSQGWPLTNMTEGGDGVTGIKRSEEYKQRMRDEWASGKRKHTPETIAKLRALKTGIPRSEETKAKIRASCIRPENMKRWRDANIGRPKSEAHRKALSESHRGVIPSAETRAKMSLAHKGKHHISEEGKHRIAESKKGKRRPDLAAWNRSPAGRAQLARLHEMARGRPRPDLAARNKARAKRI